MIEEGRNERTENGDWDSELASMMQGLGIEKAPASLRRRLKRIPREEKRPERQSWWQTPRWVMAPAMAAVALLAVGIVLMQPSRPTAEEIEQARHDVALAFAYLDRAGLRAGNEIHEVLGGELQRSVTQNISKHIPYTEQSRKEETT